jgi:RND family efflux transporter MFP subunit
VERYQALKRFTRIVAPFDGIITKRSTDVGSLINVGSAQGPELFVVSDLRKLRVYVNVPQNYTTDIRPGTKATLSVPEHAGKQYGAAVQSMSHAIDPESGSMLVQLTADNAGAELLPGGFARVKFEVAPSAGALSVPSSALIFDQSGLRVATVTADGKVALKRIVLSRDLGATIELSSGLAPGDEVIENPPDGIGDGDPVRVAAPASKAAAPGAAGKDGHASR